MKYLKKIGNGMTVDDMDDEIYDYLCSNNDNGSVYTIDPRSFSMKYAEEYDRNNNISLSYFKEFYVNGENMLTGSSEERIIEGGYDIKHYSQQAYGLPWFREVPEEIVFDVSNGVPIVNGLDSSKPILCAVYTEEYDTKYMYAGKWIDVSTVLGSEYYPSWEALVTEFKDTENDTLNPSKVILCNISYNNEERVISEDMNIPVLNMVETDFLYDLGESLDDNMFFDSMLGVSTQGISDCELLNTNGYSEYTMFKYVNRNERLERYYAVELGHFYCMKTSYFQALLENGTQNPWCLVVGKVNGDSFEIPSQTYSGICTSYHVEPNQKLQVTEALEPFDFNLQTDSETRTISENIDINVENIFDGGMCYLGTNIKNDFMFNGLILNYIADETLINPYEDSSLYVMFHIKDYKWLDDGYYAFNNPILLDELKQAVIEGMCQVLHSCVVVGQRVMDEDNAILRVVPQTYGSIYPIGGENSIINIKFIPKDSNMNALAQAFMFKKLGPNLLSVNTRFLKGLEFLGNNMFDGCTNLTIKKNP